MNKVIHYCWFGGGEKSDVIKKCIKSWKKFCPDYEIKEWNESNFDVKLSRYTKEAYERKKWAFVADYCRFYVLYNYGGIYLDTDVELIKSISGLPETFVGFERYNTVASGLIRGAKKGDKVCKQMLDDYNKDRFILKNGKENFLTVCDRETALFKKMGLKLNGKTQKVGETTVFSTEYFNPKGGSYGKDKITKNTYSIHHYLASWKSPLDQKIMKYKVKYGENKGKLLFTFIHPFLALKKYIEKNKN